MRMIATVLSVLLVGVGCVTVILGFAALAIAFLGFGSPPPTGLPQPVELGASLGITAVGLITVAVGVILHRVDQIEARLPASRSGRT